MKKKFLMLLTVILLAFPITKVYASYNQKANNVQPCMTDSGTRFGGIVLTINFNIDEGNYVSVSNMSYFFNAYLSNANCLFTDETKTSGSSTYAKAGVSYISSWGDNLDAGYLAIESDEYGNTSNTNIVTYRGKKS
ncbi:hypothetical protein [Lachnospira multipara]|uniref:Uncharacterized protein n=1 Tax=Lachnospira multipara TaxID=28051 RepID=A0A1H5XHW4_9FIRM|nr:hypothetical protein [Lachnospira multipara]SEG11055.1 hypothetical protein SAMN05216537_1342 [Lachnospira multipara]